jgi:hypothetical protein
MAYLPFTALTRPWSSGFMGPPATKQSGSHFWPAAKIGGNHCARTSLLIKQWSSVMSAIITLLYREYCKARLAEMRKLHLGGSD